MKGRLAAALVLVVGVAGVVGGVAACGGGGGESEEGRGRNAPGTVAREPVRVDAHGARVGAALRLDVIAIGRGANEGAAFEDPDRWKISARQGSDRLERLVNGPVKVDRRPAGTAQWDTVVRFNLVYRISDGAGPVLVRLKPPGGPAVVRTIKVE